MMSLQAKGKHTSTFSKYYKDLISPATHWTQICGPQLKGKWNSSNCCTACHHGKWYECTVCMSCQINVPVYTSQEGHNTNPSSLRYNPFWINLFSCLLCTLTHRWTSSEGQHFIQKIIIVLVIKLIKFCYDGLMLQILYTPLYLEIIN